MLLVDYGIFLDLGLGDEKKRYKNDQFRAIFLFNTCISKSNSKTSKVNQQSVFKKIF